MDNDSPEIAASTLNRLRVAASIANAESRKRCVGDNVVRFAFRAEGEGAVLEWSRQDGMGLASGRIPVSWDEVANAEADPLIAALRRAILAVSQSTS